MPQEKDEVELPTVQCEELIERAKGADWVERRNVLMQVLSAFRQLQLATEDSSQIEQIRLELDLIGPSTDKDWEDWIRDCLSRGHYQDDYPLLRIAYWLDEVCNKIPNKRELRQQQHLQAVLRVAEEFALKSDEYVSDEYASDVLGHLIFCVAVPEQEEEQLEPSVEDVERLMRLAGSPNDFHTGTQVFARGVLDALDSGPTDWWIAVAQAGHAPLQALCVLSRRAMKEDLSAAMLLLRRSLEQWLADDGDGERARDLASHVACLSEEGVDLSWMNDGNIPSGK